MNTSYHRWMYRSSSSSSSSWMFVSAHVQLFGIDVKDSAQAPIRMDPYRSHITNYAGATNFFLTSCLYFASFVALYSAMIQCIYFRFSLRSIFHFYCRFLRLYHSMSWFFCRCHRTSTDDALLLCSCAKWFNLGANSLTNRCAKKKYQMGEMKVWQKYIEPFEHCKVSMHDAKVHSKYCFERCDMQHLSKWNNIILGEYGWIHVLMQWKKVVSSTSSPSSSR